MTGIVTTLFIIAAIVIILTILRIYIDSRNEKEVSEKLDE